MMSKKRGQGFVARGRVEGGTQHILNSTRSAIGNLPRDIRRVLQRFATYILH